LRVVGEIKGTAAIAGSFAFVDRQTLTRILHAEGVASYVLVRARRRLDPAALARALDRRVPGVAASTRQQFATSERRVVGDMSTDIVRAIALVGFVVGIAVAGLVARSCASRGSSRPASTGACCAASPRRRGRPSLSSATTSACARSTTACSGFVERTKRPPYTGRSSTGR
jgi:putative ABC transport system permease protein